MPPAPREGSLDAPTRHPLPWQTPEFTDPETLNKELERVFDICHGCRRCVNLCQAFPTLFDLIDESETMEIDGVDPKDYPKVVDQCYLCDLCYMTKCPYVPPHEWNVDFPHLMLRAKHAHFKKHSARFRDRMLTSTDRIGKFLGIPIVAPTVNAVNRNTAARSVMHRTVGIHRDAELPPLSKTSARRTHKDLWFDPDAETSSVPTRGENSTSPDKQPVPKKVVVFATCYGNRNQPELVDDMVEVLEHNLIEVRLSRAEACCGMPKLELGDFASVQKLMDANLPNLLAAVDQGYAITAPIPSCVLMFKQELPLLFPDHVNLRRVAEHFYDPFEYLMKLHKNGDLNLDFAQPLGRVALHSACHQRVQNVGNKTREVLALIPETEITAMERCSGHDGTYAVKKETHEFSRKICRPLVRQVEEMKPDHYGSDCPLAGQHIAHCGDFERTAQHPISLLRQAYGV